MSRKTVLMVTITSAMIELAALNDRTVLEEIEDMHRSFEGVMEEIPEEERDPTVKWTP